MKFKKGDLVIVESRRFDIGLSFSDFYDTIYTNGVILSKMFNRTGDVMYLVKIDVFGDKNQRYYYEHNIKIDVVNNRINKLSILGIY